MADKSVVEGIWTTGGCTVIRFATKNPEKFNKITAIVLSDGSKINISIRQIQSKEKIKELIDHKDLLDNAVKKGYTGEVPVNSIETQRNRKIG